MSINPKVTFEHALSIFAYHVACIAKEEQRFGLHFYGNISVGVTIVRADDSNRDWDQFYFDGKLVGNRCAAREEYTRLCAPVLEQIAAGTYDDGVPHVDGVAIL